MTGSNYNVEEHQLYIFDNVNLNLLNALANEVKPKVEVSNYYTNIRTNTEEVLRVVSKSYRNVENTDALFFFDSIVDNDNGINYETAGALRNGERIFITAKLSEYIRIGEDDLLSFSVLNQLASLVRKHHRIIYANLHLLLITERSIEKIK